MAMIKLFLLVAVCVCAVLADGYGGHGYGGGHHDEGYGHGYHFGPFKYGYYGPHHDYVKVDVQGPYKEHYEYGFKAHGHGHHGYGHHGY